MHEFVLRLTFPSPMFLLLWCVGKGARSDSFVSDRDSLVCYDFVVFFQLFLSIIFSGAIAFILLVELPFSLNNTNNCSANVTLQVMIKANTPTFSFATLTVVIVPPAFSKLNQHILAGIFLLVSKLSIHAIVYPKPNLLWGWLVNTLVDWLLLIVAYSLSVVKIELLQLPIYWDQHRRDGPLRLQNSRSK